MLSVIIPTYNETKALDLVLDGFAHQTDKDFIIHIIDDGGDIPLDTIIKKHKLNITLYYLQPQSPLFRAGAARNLGIRECRTDRILFHDHDSVPSPNVVAEHAKYGDQKLIICSNRQYIPQEQWPTAADSIEIAKLAMGNRISISIQQSRIKGQITNVRNADCNAELYLRDIYDPNKGGIYHAWEDVWGCSMSMPCTLLKSIGGYWEEFVGWGGEDVELGMRMVAAGCRVVLRPDINTYHLNHPRRNKTAQWDRIDTLLAQSMAMPTLIRNGGPL